MSTSNLEAKIKDFEKRQKIISVLVLFIFCGIAVVLNNLHLTSVAQESTKFLSRYLSMGDQREVTLVLHQAHLSNFKIIRFVSKMSDRSFVIPAKTFLNDEQTFFKSIIYDKVETPIDSSITSFQGDVIVYEFNRFILVPYAVLAWILMLLISLPQIIFLKRRVITQFEKDVEFEKKAGKAEIAREVRHNLRTPLAALMRIPQRLPSSLSNEKDLLEVTINQIKELVSKLDESRPCDLVKSQSTQIYDTLLSARQEIKEIIPSRIDFKFEIEDMLCSDLVSHIPFELRAILSNMVLNSIEAIEGRGSIVVRAIESASRIIIKISDTGIGIPENIIPRLFEKDFSYKKEKGSGIGLYHAKSFISQWGGTIQAESIEGSGTIFTISLPIKDKASWHLEKLNVNPSTSIFILDDQQSALKLWKQKLEETSYLNQSFFYHDISEFEKDSLKWNGDSIFLIDFDMGSLDKNGIELLKSVPQESMRCLVTGHFDDLDVRNQCEALGFYLVPKSSIESLKI